MNFKFFMISCIIFSIICLIKSQTLITNNIINQVTNRTDYILNEIFMKNLSINEKLLTNNILSDDLLESPANDLLETKLSSSSSNSNNILLDEIISNSDEKQTNNNNKNYKITTFNDNKTDEDTEGFISRQKTFLDHYYEGVRSYLSNDWINCIHYLELSIQLYRDYYNTLTYCRIQCESERLQIKYLHNEDLLEHHNFFEGLLNKALCMEKCRQEHLGSYSKWFSFDTEQKYIFKERKPYQYLQLCYYRDNEIGKAIQATYTSLVVNSGDELMKKNIRFYATLNDFNLENLKDLEDKEFSEFYLKGIAQYDEENWVEAIENFEKFIKSWIMEHNKCRAFCDGEFYQGWLPDFVTAMSNHYVFTLRCKQNCTKELSYTNGRFYEDLLPSAYDYLQFSYFKVGEIRKACECVKSYFLFYPNSEEMLETLKFYKNLDETNDEYFKERSEAKQFVMREKYDNDILDFVDIEFTKLVNNEDQTFRQLPIQSDLSGSAVTKTNAKETQNVDTNNNDINFIKIIENYKENLIKKLKNKY